jgi:hypothetical protein
MTGLRLYSEFVNLRINPWYMSANTITKLYDLLIPKLGKEGAENLTTFIESKIENGLEDNTKRLATKEDLGNVRTELANVRIEVANVRTEVANVRTEVANVKSELLDKIGETRTEMIRWMFVFWIGQLAGTIGIVLLFLRK